MKTTVTFGELMVRITAPGVLRIRQAYPGPAEISFAGSEANVAESLAIQGCPSRFVTVLPENDVAECALSALRGRGVDTSCVVRRPSGRMGAYYVEGGASQRSSKVVYDRAGSLFSQCGRTAYRFSSAFRGADWLHVSGVSPAVSRKSADAALWAVKEAKKRGMTVSWDLNFRSKLWRWDPSRDPKTLAQEITAEILKYVDVVIGNIEDSDSVGIYTNDRIETNPDFCHEMMRRWPNLRLIVTILREIPTSTSDTWGGIIYDPATDRQTVAPLDGKGNYDPWRIDGIVDAIGTGDAFSAGLIYALKDPEINTDYRSVLEYTLACSCLAHTIKGDCNWTTREDVLALLKKGRGGRVQR